MDSFLLVIEFDKLVEHLFLLIPAADDSGRCRCHSLGTIELVIIIIGMLDGEQNRDEKTETLVLFRIFRFLFLHGIDLDLC